MIRVLLVEDDEDIAKLIRLGLGKWGFEVEHIDDGLKAIERFRSAPFDVMLVDAQLPGCDGFTIAREVRAGPRGGKVGMIMVSAGFRTDSARARAVKAGFDDFYAKPFVLSDVAQALIRLAEIYTGAKPSRPQRRRPKVKARPTAPASVDVGARSSASAASHASSSSSSSSSSAVSRPAPGAPTVGVAAASSAPSPSKPAAPTPLDGPVAARWFLLRLAEERFTGVARLRHAASLVEVGLIDGAACGAWDNARENWLGERLLASGTLSSEAVGEVCARMEARGERFAEAAVALGVLSPAEALWELREQARARVHRALAFSGGEAERIDDRAAAERLYVSRFDLAFETLTGVLEEPLSEFTVDRIPYPGSAPVVATASFEPGMLAFAKLAPDSALPGMLFVGPTTVSAAAGSDPKRIRELYAMWAAGLVQLADATPPQVHVRLGVLPDDVEHEVDAGAAIEIQARLLAAQGRDHYALLSLTSEASHAQVEDAIAAARRAFGPETFSSGSLGPARAAAEELWGRIEDAAYDLLDPGRRAAYDDTLSPRSVKQHVGTSPRQEAESAFEAGRAFMNAGDIKAAWACFARATQKRPVECEYVAWLGWATLVLGDEPTARAIAILESAHALSPEAKRPLLFLGEAWLRQGDVEKGRRYVIEAARRSPEDPEVRAAMATLAELA